MKIFCTNAQTALYVDREQVKDLVQAFLVWKEIKSKEIGIYFVNKTTIAKLHNRYFRDPSPTDCISFPMDAPNKKSVGYNILGELFICPEVACEYAKEHHLFPLRELSLYIIHGLLHLLGYSDQDPLNMAIMRNEENLSMKYLQDKGKLLHD